jgi:coenzyme F420-reducing hydrogenase beta subunit
MGDRVEDEYDVGTAPVDETHCTLCGLCVEVCPCQAVKLGKQGPVFTCPEDCSRTSTGDGALDCCLLCEEVCPTGALPCAFEIVAGADTLIPSRGYWLICTNGNIRNYVVFEREDREFLEDLPDDWVCWMLGGQGLFEKLEGS